MSANMPASPLIQSVWGFLTHYTQFQTLLLGEPGKSSNLCRFSHFYSDRVTYVCPWWNSMERVFSAVPGAWAKGGRSNFDVYTINCESRFHQETSALASSRVFLVSSFFAKSQAVSPCLFAALTSAPSPARVLIASRCPFLAAYIRAVRPSLPVASISAPSPPRVLIASTCPYIAACIRAVDPCLSVALTSAPSPARVLIVSRCPFLAAYIRAVRPLLPVASISAPSPPWLLRGSSWSRRFSPNPKQSLLVCLRH